jgi:hypothetical protein
VTICLFLPWAKELEPVDRFIERIHHLDLRKEVSDPDNPSLIRMAALDSQWHAECARCIGTVQPKRLPRISAMVTGREGLAAFGQAALRRSRDEPFWLMFMGQHPKHLGPSLQTAGALLQKVGVRFVYYSFDNASRNMECFGTLAPFLNILIHDESPLGPAAELLPADCARIHRSWVANLVPFSAPFVEAPERKIFFLGSQLGLTANRQRQMDFLRAEFQDRFIASHDHSLDVGDRTSVSRYKVSLCPEGRMFTAPAMSSAHTDRPFWSGCLGMVPVCEDSATGGRLESLAAERLILRYPHEDLRSLKERCEEALEMPTEDRLRLYHHFNRHETVGAVIGDALAVWMQRQNPCDDSAARGNP